METEKGPGFGDLTSKKEGNSVQGRVAAAQEWAPGAWGLACGGCVEVFSSI